MNKIMNVKWKNEKAVIMQAGGRHLTIQHSEEDEEVRAKE